MIKAVLMLIAGLLLIGANVFAQDDVRIDNAGNISTGASASGKLEVTGSSAGKAIMGLSSGTGGTGVEGRNTTYGNFGILGGFNGPTQIGVYGSSDFGYAGYFEGDARVTGDFIVDGNITGFTETDPTVNALGKASLGCAEGEIAKVISGVWDCGADVDTNTTYSAGTGLDLTGTTFDVEVPLHLSGTGEVVKGTNTSTGNYGFLGSSVFGVVGYAPAAGGIAVSGNSDSGYGGYFYSNTGYGLVVQKGNVGIGTISPGTELEVVGDGTFTGNVGIGTTTSPTERLSVAGTIESTDSVKGVVGTATDTGAVTNYGGLFQADGDSGYGVYGKATATGAVTNYGGYFESAGDSGYGVYAKTTGSNSWAIWAENATSGNWGLMGALTAAILGDAQASSGKGVEGRSTSNIGVHGISNADIGVAGSATATGAVTNYGGHFQADGDSGYGVYGKATATGAVMNYGGYFESAGDQGYGVYGKATSTTGGNTSYGGYFESHDIGLYATGDDYAIDAHHQSSGNYVRLGTQGFYGESLMTHNGSTSNEAFLSTDSYAGLFDGDVIVVGDLDVSLDLAVEGTKNFIQPHRIDPSKEIVYIAAEAPEAVVMHRGTASLIDGKAVIELPEHFRAVSSEGSVQVQVTPAEDCNGIFVSNKSREQIVVKELMAGKHNAKFDYFITAVRAGFENQQPVIANEHFKPRENESAEEFERRYEKDDMSTKAIRSMLISNGILTKEGKLNMALVEKLGWTVAEKRSSSDDDLRAELIKK